MTNTEISINDLAEMSNLTTRRIRQLATDGKLPKPKRGIMPLVESMQRLFAHYQKVDAETTAERLALLKARRATAELELGRATGRLIEAAHARIRLVGFARGYHAFVKRAMEHSGPKERADKLRELAITPEVIAGFKEWDSQQGIKIIDEIEARCAASETETI